MRGSESRALAQQSRDYTHVSNSWKESAEYKLPLGSLLVESLFVLGEPPSHWVYEATMDPTVELSLLQRRFPDRKIGDCGKLISGTFDVIFPVFFCLKHMTSHV